MITIKGAWDKGFSFGWYTQEPYLLSDHYVTSSELLNKRSCIGGHISAAKRHGNTYSIEFLISLFNMLQGIEDFDYILSAPPSANSNRYNVQHVISQQLSGKYNVPYLDGFFLRSGSRQVKSIPGKSNRINYINENIKINSQFYINENSKFLLLDDIYETGATLNSLSKKLKLKYKKCYICCIALSITTEKNF